MYIFVNHALFILYLEGNHTLFGEKLYFIWKFSSGNTDIRNSVVPMVPTIYVWTLWLIVLVNHGYSFNVHA